jgi:hypothetical protein
LSQGE